MRVPFAYIILGQSVCFLAACSHASSTPGLVSSSGGSLDSAGSLGVGTGGANHGGNAGAGNSNVGNSNGAGDANGGASGNVGAANANNGGSPGASGSAGASQAGQHDAGSDVDAAPTVRVRGEVSVGGVDGFDAFVSASSSALLVAGGASLYIHQVGWGQLASDQDRKQIAANWSSTGGAVVEMAEATDLAASFIDLGIPSILEINVNAPSCSNGPDDDDSIAAWTNWVASYKAHGVVRAQYNDTPNCQTSGFD